MSRAIDRARLDAPADARATVDDLRDLLTEGRPLLDVRAPVEFAKGAFPGAINRPLLTDDERHAVGVRYKQQGQDAAIVLGAELLDDAERARRVATWKAFAEENPDGALYCFRGGLRSQIAQAWLADAGIELPLVSGGYKAMRGFLIETLARLCERMSLRIVGGRTGVGKTLLIRQLGRTVDLEGVAHHRGSSFGGMAGAQPGNIDFENRVTIALMRLDADDREAPIWLEDEARLIGRVAMPEALVQAMRCAPIEILEAPLEQRVANCIDDYVVDLLERYREIHDLAGMDTGAHADSHPTRCTPVSEDAFAAFAAHHRDSLSRVRKRLGGDNYRLAGEQLDTALARHKASGDTSGYVPFIELMLQRYYDPMYDYQLESKCDRVQFSGDAATILARHDADGSRAG